MLSENNKSTTPEAEAQPTGNVQLGSDGAYRWIYRMELKSNSWQFWLVIKVFAIMMGGVAILFSVISLIMGDFTIWDIAVPMFAMLFIILIAFIVWLFYILISHGEYWAMFVMDENSVTQIQIDKTYERLQALNILAIALASSPSAKLSAAGRAGSTASKSLRTNFSSVKTVIIDREHCVIILNTFLIKSAVYTTSEDYEFVLNHILSRVSQDVKIVEKN